MHAERSILRGAAAAAAALAFVGCSGSSAPPNAISADLTEFKVSTTSVRAASGTVTFTIKNAGTIVHEFVVVKSDLATDKLPTTADGKVDEESAELAGVDEVEDIAAGATATLKVDLAVGKYILICNLPGHYVGGMRASLEVAAS
jgi:uncharacterized cupredoxin-like copper-binding protein